MSTKPVIPKEIDNFDINGGCSGLSSLKGTTISSLFVGTPPYIIKHSGRIQLFYEVPGFCILLYRLWIWQNTNNKLNMKLLFYFVCYFTTLFLLGYCLYLYLRNDDVTEINYKEWNEDSQSPYPSFTFCLKLRPNLTKVNSIRDQTLEVNESRYLEFLSGTYWDENFLRSI